MELNLDFFLKCKAVKEAMTPSPFTGTDLGQWAGVSPPTKGLIAEKVLQEFLEVTNTEYEKRSDPGHDIIIAGKKVECKFATLNRDYGFIWNQIRPASDFTHVVFMALYPTLLECYWTTKEEALNCGHAQHSGDKNNSVMIVHEQERFPDVFKRFETAQFGLPSTPPWFSRY